MEKTEKTLFERLAEPMEFKWRAGPGGKQLAYIDARAVMDRLDEVVSPENWQSDFKEVKGNVYAGVGIKFADEWVWKWDVGVESNIEEEKGEASDSFKRAAVKWGVGRFLYDIKSPQTAPQAPTGAYKPEGETLGICPKCKGGQIVERTAKTTGKKFWGCSAFPGCDYVSWTKPEVTE